MKRILSLLVVLGPATAHADKVFDAGKGATWDCAQDDDVTINTSNGVYTFKGTCDDIKINGSNVKVTIERVEDLEINGSRNSVNVDAVDEIEVNGSDNTVTYKGSLRRKTPVIENNGSKNTITPGRTSTPSAPATPGANVTVSAPAGATRIDCASQNAVSIKNGKGSYQLVGTCEKVSVAGSENRIEIEATKNLAITGSSNDIAVGKSDKIAALGSNNRVTWGAGLTLAKPKIAIAGKGNTVTAGTSPSAPPPPSTAASGTRIDCSKSASHVISTDKGNYTFTGTCDVLQVDGNYNNLRIESARSVALHGNYNNVDASALDRLATQGNYNNVRYAKPATATKVTIANPGNGNTIAKK